MIADHEKVVIATAGGMVSTSPETYALLLVAPTPVWVKAQPQEHMSRVIAQGDFRPMSENRRGDGGSRRHSGCALVGLCAGGSRA